MNTKQKSQISKVLPISKALLASLSALLFFCFAATAQADDEQEAFPRIPSQTLDKYSLSQITKRLESIDVQLMQVNGGNLTFNMEPIPNHSPAPSPGDVSLRLVHYANPQLHVEISSFKAEDFGFDFNEATLRKYLQGIQMQFAEEQNFEILQEPVQSTGPARFRFLGRRSIPLKYRFILGDNDLTREENWFLVDGSIHVISVQGLSRSFEGYFQSIRIPFNSSVSLSN